MGIDDFIDFSLNEGSDIIEDGLFLFGHVWDTVYVEVNKGYLKADI